MCRLRRRWIIVASIDPRSEAISPFAGAVALHDWLNAWQRRGLNRYWTPTAAEMDLEQHQKAYDGLLEFRVADRFTQEDA